MARYISGLVKQFDHLALHFEMQGIQVSTSENISYLVAKEWKELSKECKDANSLNTF